MNDLRFALRQLIRRPGFAATAVVTLALGIGATTAIFSVVNAVLLRPLPYRDADRLVTVWESHPEWSERNLVSSGSYLDWRDRASVFETLGARSNLFSAGIAGDAAPDHILGLWITPDLLRTLGVAPAVGRPLAAEGDAASEMLISHGLWQRRFGGDSGVVGRTVQLEERPVTIVGVMPPAFDFPSPDAEFWLPLHFDAEDREARRSHRWQVLGRLGPDVTVAEAQAEMDVITARMRAEHPEAMTGWSARVIPFRADLTAGVRPTVLILFGVVVLVLLVACANVANLLLSRAVTRERELAIRGALGAERPRIVRQLLTESLLLATAGGAIGVALAYWGIEVLVAAAPPGIPLLDDAQLDLRVLGAAVLASFGAALVFGLVPALRLSRIPIGTALRSGPAATGGPRHGMLRRALLVGEIALALVLVAGAGLLVRSLIELHNVDPGFRPDGLLAVSIDLPYTRYDGTAAHEAFYQRLLERVEALPGVQSAAGTPEPPVVGFNNTFSYVIAGRPRSGPDGRESPVEVRAVTPGYFATMGVPLRRGRAFTSADRDGAPLVGIVNETLARRHWPDGGAVGRRLSFDENRQGPWIEIVGVAGDTRHYGLEAETAPALYIPYAQKRWSWMSWMTLVIRTTGDPMALAPAVRQTVWSLDDRLPIRRMAPVAELYARREAERRFVTGLLTGFAGLALVLGVVGVYGVIGYAIAQRRREIGLRVALGARPAAVAASVLREGLALTLVGVALGLGGALAVTRLLRGLLFGVAPYDPLTLAAVALLLLVAALAATWLPARRASRIDPMEALRHE